MKWVIFNDLICVSISLACDVRMFFANSNQNEIKYLCTKSMTATHGNKKEITRIPDADVKKSTISNKKQ